MNRLPARASAFLNGLANLFEFGLAFFAFVLLYPFIFVLLLLAGIASAFDVEIIALPQVRWLIALARTPLTWLSCLFDKRNK